MIRKYLHRYDVNSAVVYTLLTKIWGMGRGFVTALLITQYFTPEIQGYFYMFTSILGITVFVELGLGRVIIQFASHEWARLKLNNNGTIIGPPNSLSRLVSLGRLTYKWYGFGSIIIFFVTSIIGFQFFSQNNDPNITWKSPWITLCLLNGVNLSMIPLLALLEGSNMIKQVSAFRFFQSVVVGFGVWIAIILGANLWSLSIINIVSLFCTIMFIYIFYRNYFKSFIFYKVEEKIDWKNEILPMQWRMAISWVSAFFAFKLFSPVLFHYYGPIVAGQMGMTWVLVGAVGSISSSFVIPKGPIFGILISKGKIKELHNMFFKLVKIVILIGLMGSILLCLLIFFINYYNHEYSTRLLPVIPTIFFLIGSLINSISLPFSLYLRAHKKEPLYLISICYALLIGMTTIILGKEYGPLGIGIGYCLVNLLLFPFTLFIWKKFYIKYYLDSSSKCNS